jgi:hypothetical protein
MREEYGDECVLVDDCVLHFFTPQVATVVVADDCALPEGKGVTGGRGVAGTVFVHKVRGERYCASASSGFFFFQCMCFFYRHYWGVHTYSII